MAYNFIMNIGVRLNRLKQEDFIWIIYIFIAIAALYSNSLEKDYYIKNNKNAFYKEKAINTTILVIAFFIYLYFLLLTTEDLSNMEKNFRDKSYIETFAKLIAAILFLVGGAIYVVIELTSAEPEEVGFI